MVRYNAEGPAGLRDRPRPGRRSRLDEARRAALWDSVVAGPDVERTGLGAWTRTGLCREVEARWGVEYDPSVHGQDRPSPRAAAAEGAAGAPERGSGRAGGVRKRGLHVALDAACAAHPGRRLTLWFEDEARFGQKGRVCRRWFTRGTRPPGLCDQRCTWAHVFAAVRPATGEDFALVLPHVSTAATNAFLARFAAALAGDEHAALVINRAGWHASSGPRVPDNVTLFPLPPCSPELNLVERVWLYPRDRHLGHRLPDDHDPVVEGLCAARNAFTPERLRSLAAYPYLDEVTI